MWGHLLSLHREDKVMLLDSYYYDDGCEPCGEDTFSREPFIVKFHAQETGELFLNLPGELSWPGTVTTPQRGQSRPLLYPWVPRETGLLAGPTDAPDGAAEMPSQCNWARLKRVHGVCI